ncbi:pentapeptide repeat-containing protein [Amycolatopsis sp. NPDC004625]|uniref:pentapeptide repeat-containing protein n=1 Tax=Amycolatopsis sp. NPDC004625 TaxID=3154670 RepID=UPI0033B9ADC7
MLMFFGSLGRGWAPARGALVLSGVALLAAMVVQSGWVDWPALGRWARPLAVPLALLAVAVGGLVIAVARRRGERAPQTRRARAAGMSWWVVVAAAIVVAAVGWAATSWLLGEADQAGTGRSAARVEAIKTGLGIGAGTTGIFALLLAVRRQQHNESDATEKNVTELYTKAADQLGSEQAPVRMAGLYALERLAHNNPGQRQSIVNVVCAYLRMPFTPPDTQPPPATDEAQVKDHQGRVQEREVRLAAQRILAEHLRPENRRTFWADIDLDLTNAHLIDFVLSRNRVREALFTGANFTGPAYFDRATFTGPARFNRATFTGPARFDDATFTSTTEFDDATFTGPIGFEGATFRGPAWFDGATFISTARFAGATFTSTTEFDNATFTSTASFDDAAFTGTARFDGATFIGEVRFDRARFTSVSGLDTVTVIGGARFADVSLLDHSPEQARALLRTIVKTARTTSRSAIVDLRDFRTVTSQQARPAKRVSGT